jgi:starch phosphorylase
VQFGVRARLAVGARLNGLAPSDVAVELLLWDSVTGQDAAPLSFAFAPAGASGTDGEQRFELELAPEFCGKLAYRIRVYPRHELLTHRFELGLMRWL